MPYSARLDAQPLKDKQRILKKVIAQRELLSDAEMSRIRNKLVKQEANLNVVLPIFGILRGIFEDESVYEDIYTEEGRKLAKVFKETELTQKLKQAFLGDRKSTDKATLLEMMKEMSPKIANITQTQRTGINMLLNSIQSIPGDEVDASKLESAVSDTNKEILQDAGAEVGTSTPSKAEQRRRIRLENPNLGVGNQIPMGDDLYRIIGAYDNGILVGESDTTKRRMDIDPLEIGLGEVFEGASESSTYAERLRYILDAGNKLRPGSDVVVDGEKYRITKQNDDGTLQLENAFDKREIDPLSIPIDDDGDFIPDDEIDESVAEVVNIPDDTGYVDYINTQVPKFSGTSLEKDVVKANYLKLWKDGRNVLHMGETELKGNASKEGLARGASDNSIRYRGAQLKLTRGIQEFLMNPSIEAVGNLSGEEADSIDIFAEYLKEPLKYELSGFKAALAERAGGAPVVNTRRQPIVPQPRLLSVPTQGRGNPRNFAPKVAPEVAEFDAKTGLLNRSESSAFTPVQQDINPQYISRKHTPLRVDKNGVLGKVRIDMANLLNHLDLIVHDNQTGGHLLTRRSVPIDFLQLMTKRYNKNVNYSKEGAGLYRQVVKLAKIPLDRSGKGLKQNILIVKKPSQVIKRFESLIGHISSGGNNKELKKEVALIADYLLKERMITADELQYINKEYVG